MMRIANRLAARAKRSATAQERLLMRRKPFLPQLAAAVLLALCLSCERSAAEVRLSGTSDRIVMQTNGATIPEILAALRSAFDLEVKLKGATARTFTGEYSGTVRQVLSRLLAGEDYILRSDSEGIASSYDAATTRRSDSEKAVMTSAGERR
jgi:hypothetical protein